VSLTPEPPQIFRSGAFRRGGITVEPVWIRWQGTNVQVYTGNGGLIAEFNALELSPLSDPECIGESELSAGGAAWLNSDDAGWDNFDFHTMNYEYIQETYSQPRTFLVNNHLFYIQARGKNGLMNGVFEASLDHPGGWTYANWFPEFFGITGAICDLLVVKINIDDGTITSASQVCMTMSIDINYTSTGIGTYVRHNYDMSVDIPPVVSFLSQQTGLSEKHFAASHSNGGSWTINSSTWTTTSTTGSSVTSLEASKHRGYYMTGLPSQTTKDFYQSDSEGWASPDSTTMSWPDRDDSVRNWTNHYYPGPSWFIPYQHGGGAQQDAIYNRQNQDNGRATRSWYGWVGEFYEIPRWAGLDTVNGVVSAYIRGSGYFCPIEVSSFDPNLGDIAGIGRSEFSGSYEDLLLDPETDIDFEMESVSDELKAAIAGPPRKVYCSSFDVHAFGDGGASYADHSLMSSRSSYDYDANQMQWLENPAETRPETSDPQYFWSNLEGAKFHLPVYLALQATGDANMHYRISV